MMSQSHIVDVMVILLLVSHGFNTIDNFKNSFAKYRNFKTLKTNTPIYTTKLGDTEVFHTVTKLTTAA